MTVRKKRKVNNKTKKKIFLFVLVFISVIVIFEIRLKPIVNGIAEVQSKSLSTILISQTVNDILEETGITCDELEEINLDSNGSISSINTNTVVLNKLKNMISVRIQNNLADIKNKRVNVPLGTLLGSNLFNGQGPNIPLYITLSGNVASDFESAFESGGINQTVHKLSINVSAEITVIMPMSTFTTNVDTSVIIGETVIVGSVPSGMLYRS